VKQAILVLAAGGKPATVAALSRYTQQNQGVHASGRSPGESEQMMDVTALFDPD
jgi:hypothetical protein